MSKKNEAQKLQEELTWSAPHIAKEAPEQKEKAFKYCEGYKEFLNKGKTERECVKEAVKMLKKAGYKPFDRKASYVPGDKVYVVNRDRHNLWKEVFKGWTAHQRSPYRRAQTGFKTISAL